MSSRPPGLWDLPGWEGAPEVGIEGTRDQGKNREIPSVGWGALGSVDHTKRLTPLPAGQRTEQAAGI